MRVVHHTRCLGEEYGRIINMSRNRPSSPLIHQILKLRKVSPSLSLSFSLLEAFFASPISTCNPKGAFGLPAGPLIELPESGQEGGGLFAIGKYREHHQYTNKKNRHAGGRKV